MRQEAGRSQKCLAARSPSSTVPDTANTTLMLTRFRVIIEIVEAATGSGPDFLRRVFFDGVLADMASPEMAGQAV